jgi:hypothetical protein
VDNAAVSMPVTQSLKAFISPQHKVHLCNDIVIMLFNQLLDMPHLSGGWIILENKKCSQTGM